MTHYAIDHIVKNTWQALLAAIICATFSISAYANTEFLALPAIAPAAGESAPAKTPLSPEKEVVPPIVPSLFYTKEEMKKIQLAINSHLKYSTGSEEALTSAETDFLDDLASVFGASKKIRAYYTYPQFFLKSLV